MPEANLSTELGSALTIDAVLRFGEDVRQLTDLLENMTVIPVREGDEILRYTSSVDLQDGNVAPGAVIPLSKVSLTVADSEKLNYEKYRVAVPFEDIQKYGQEVAVSRVNQKALNKIKSKVKGDLISGLADGTLVQTGENFKQLIAKNTAAVKIAFEDDDPEVISFVNTMDAYDYLGAAELTVQKEFGLEYLSGFLGNKIVFMSGDIPRGTIYTTAENNLQLYHVDINTSEAAALFNFVSDETGLIGITMDQNNSRLQFETVFAAGMLITAERIDGVVVGTLPAEGETDPEAGGA